MADGGEQGMTRAAPAPAPVRKRSRTPFVAFGVLLVVAAVAGTAWWYVHRNEIETDDAYTDGRAVAVSPRIAGQVTALLVNDNQYVHAGQVLLRIDPRDFRIAYAKAEAGLRSAQAQLINARANRAIVDVAAPAKLAQAEADLAQAEADRVRAALDARREHAVPAGATTRQTVDAADAALKSAEASVAKAEAEVASARTVAEQRQQAEAEIGNLQAAESSAQAALDQAALDLAHTEVKAPQDGWITVRAVEMGDYVQVGQALLTIVTPDVWVTANFKETELARIKPGDAVDMRLDSKPGLKLRGHVDSVQLGSGARFSAFPAENATGNFVKIVQRVPVKIDIDSGLPAGVGLPLGVSVEPTVHVK